MLLIFDGPDKVGKTTLIHEIDKATNYEHIMIDRGPTSYLVYDKLLGRECDARKFEYLRDLQDLESISHLCIYLKATEEDVEKRLNEVGEKPILGIPHVEFDTEFNKELFVEKHRCSNLIVINTSDFSIEENVKAILRAIDKVQLTQYPLFKLKEKSVTNKIKRDELGYTEFYPSYNSYSLDMLNMLNLSFVSEIDKPFYDMLYASLSHMLHKKAIGWLNYRQMTYTSNDCISFVQLIPTDDNKYDLLICQRSLDLKKHGYNDLLFFVDWAKRNSIKLNNIHYNIAIPHMYY